MMLWNLNNKTSFPFTQKKMHRNCHIVKIKLFPFVKSNKTFLMVIDKCVWFKIKFFTNAKVETFRKKNSPQQCSLCNFQ